MTVSAPREETPDYLAACHASVTGNPVLEQIRDRGAEAVLALFRLVKNVLVHAIDNRAVTQTATQSEQLLRDFAAVVGNEISITFIAETVFVCGQLLRASRSTYDSAMDLGRAFERCGLSEVSVEIGVTADDLLAFGAAFAAAYRDPGARAALLEVRIPHMRIRRVQAELQRRVDIEHLPLKHRILRLYATALVVMRGFYDGIAQGGTILPHRVKRLAQRFVALSETGDPSFLGLIAMANAERDDPSRAVLAAILSVVIGRQVTSDRLVLARLAMNALLGDVGRVNMVGTKGRDELIALSEDMEASIPAATASVCIATGGVNTSNALRTVATTEATWLEREALLGPLYGNRLAPLVESQVLRLARAVVDELAPRDAATPPKSPLDALEAVAVKPRIDVTLLRLLVNAVGLIPTGCVVEFETGEWGVVVGPSKNPDAFDRPIVRLVADRNGQPFSPTREVDLGASPDGRPLPRILNAIAPKHATFNIPAVFFE